MLIVGGAGGSFGVGRGALDLDLEFRFYTAVNVRLCLDENKTLEEYSQRIASEKPLTCRVDTRGHLQGQRLQSQPRRCPMAATFQAWTHRPLWNCRLRASQKRRDDVDGQLISGGGWCDRGVVGLSLMYYGELAISWPRELENETRGSKQAY